MKKADVNDSLRAHRRPINESADPEPSLGAIVEAFVNRDWDGLTEASLSRIYHHFKNSGQKSFAILTSWRSELGDAENRTNFGDLQKRVRAQGYGFSKMTGFGQEEGGKVSSYEPSLFVHGMSMKHAIEHGESAASPKAQQNAIIYSGPETGGRVHLVQIKDDPESGMKKGDHMDLGEFHPRKTGQFYSRLRNHQFKSGRDDMKPDKTAPKGKHTAQVPNRDVFKFEAYDEPILGWKYDGANIGESEAMSLQIKRRLEERARAK